MIPSPSKWTSKSKTWAQARKANKDLENAAIHRIILRPSSRAPSARRPRTTLTAEQFSGAGEIAMMDSDDVVKAEESELDEAEKATKYELKITASGYVSQDAATEVQEDKP